MDIRKFFTVKATTSTSNSMTAPTPTPYLVPTSKNPIPEATPQPAKVEKIKKHSEPIVMDDNDPVSVQHSLKHERIAKENVNTKIESRNEVGGLSSSSSSSSSKEAKHVKDTKGPKDVHEMKDTKSTKAKDAKNTKNTKNTKTTKPSSTKKPVSSRKKSSGNAGSEIEIDSSSSESETSDSSISSSDISDSSDSDSDSSDSSDSEDADSNDEDDRRRKTGTKPKSKTANTSTKEVKTKLPAKTVKRRMLHTDSDDDMDLKSTQATKKIGLTDPKSKDMSQKPIPTVVSDETTSKYFNKTSDITPKTSTSTSATKGIKHPEKPVSTTHSDITHIPAPTPTVSSTTSSAQVAPAAGDKRVMPKWLAAKGQPPRLGQKPIPNGAPNCLGYGGGGEKYVAKFGDGPSNATPITFVISGTLESLERNTAEHLIKRFGGRVTGGVTGKTDYLLCGDDVGPKKEKDAKEKNVKIINEDGFFDIIIKRSPNVSQSHMSATDTSTSTPTPITTATTIAPAPSTNLSTPQQPSNAPAIATPSASTTASSVAPVKRSLYGRNATPSSLPRTPSLPSSSNTSILPVTAGISGDISKKVPSKSAGTDLWVEKWKPNSIHEIVGNGTNVKAILEFLQQFHSNVARDNAAIQKAQLSGAKSKSAVIAATKAGSPRAILISGAPGTGKTTAANLCALAAGFEVLEFNASDTRSKLSIREEVGSLLDNHALSEYMTSNKNEKSDPFAALNSLDFSSSSSSSSKAHTNTISTSKKPRKRMCVVMDEVDGVSSSDRGGIGELIALIKTTKTPIICICNDGSDPKMRSLKNHCLHLSWRRPTAQQILPRLTTIAQAEGLAIDKNAIIQLATATRADLRQAINSMQMWAIADVNTVTYDMAYERTSKNAKDFDVGPFEIVPEFFKSPAFGTNWLDERVNLYFVDSNITPLFIQENYLSANAAIDPKSSIPPAKQSFLKYSMAADLISLGDVMGKSVMIDQNFALMPSHGALSTVLPGVILGGGLNAMMMFPSVLGKMSTTNKNKNLLHQLKSILLLDSPQTIKSLVMDYLPLLRTKLMKPLSEQGVDGIDTVLQEMGKYGLTKADWDTIMDLGEAFSEIKSNTIDSKAKAALTRASKKEGPKVKVTRFGENKSFKATKTKANGFTTEDQEWEAANGEVDDDEDDDEEKSPKNEDDDMIIQLPTTSTSKTTSKTAPKATASKKKK